MEQLFYNTYFSYLKGDYTETLMYYNMLRTEFNEKKNADALSTAQLYELAKVRKALNIGRIETSSWVKENTTDTVGSLEKTEVHQKDLVRKLHETGLLKIQECLGDTVSIYNIEHPCPPYGYVDMVYMGVDTVYPVEVKRHEGRHDLVGQIDKYTLYFKLLLHYKLYRRVQPVTICGSYDNHTLAELKRVSVVPLRYAVLKNEVAIHVA